MKIDIFGWKAQARVAELEAQIFNQAKIIRNMDQRIWSMGQQPSWELMRPIYQELQIDTESRMNNEGNRIRSLLIPEIIKVYS